MEALVNPAGEIDLHGGFERGCCAGFGSDRIWRGVGLKLGPPGGTRFQIPIGGMWSVGEKRPQFGDSLGSEVQVLFQATEDNSFQLGADVVGRALARRDR